MHTTIFQRNKSLMLAMSLPMLLLVGCAGDKEKNQITDKPLAQVEAMDAVPEAASLSPIVAEVTSMPEQENSIVKTTDTEQPVSETEKFPRIEMAANTKPEKRIFHFNFGASKIEEADVDILKQHAKYLSEHPHMILQVSGHTDSHGPKSYNRYLSKQRAETVAKLLIEFGAPKAQIHIEGLADERPYAQAKSWKDHRRVELDYDNLELVNKD